LWMGDIETDFLEKVKDEIDFEEIDVLFAPHHGRESGKIPEDILTVLNPKIVVIGEAKSKDLNYYSGYNTITQNSAGDITFDCVDGKVHIYVGSDTYSVDFLNDEKQDAYDNYIGSFDME
jgi:beta-lactamase superfamily II metal-dependent hydrolase